MINWKSNVFPGILGRTCDRPCEPACRRSRVEDETLVNGKKEPVAICRLKRVAADFKDDEGIKASMPKAPEKNGKRIACIGGGPASLTVARDLAVLGYEIVIYDQDPKLGGFIRTQIPHFRLPEVGDRRGSGLHHRYRQHRVPPQEDRLDEGRAGRRLRRGLRRLRRAARPRSRRAGPQGSGCQHPYRPRLAVVGLVRPYQQGRQARDRAGWRQHRHGLLPHRPPSGRRGCEGHRPLRLRGDEGLAVGEGRRDGRGHPHPEHAGAEGSHAQQRQDHRRAVREGQGRVRRQGPPLADPVGRTRPAFRMRRRAGGDRPGERLPVDRGGRRRRVRQMGPAQAQRADVPEHRTQGLLRRRRRFRPQEHHLGRGPRP